MGKRKILCIDDDDSILDLLEDILTVAGYEVDTADKGFDGLARASRTLYDAIISDLKMPDLDGIGLVEKVKSTMNATTPVFVISGALDSGSIAKLEKLGVLHSISKPFRSNDLLDKIHKITMKSDEPIGYHPEVVRVFNSSIQKVFSFYLGAAPMPEKSSIRKTKKSICEFSSVIPLFGRRLYGSLSISWDQQLSDLFAKKIMENVEGQMTQRLRMEVIAETLRQIALEAKRQFEKKDIFIFLGLPEVYKGEEHYLPHKVGTPKVCVPFTCGLSKLYVEFALGFDALDPNRHENPLFNIFIWPEKREESQPA